MSLFMCTQCGCVENTALSEHWRQESEAFEAGKTFEPLCSLCFLGQWHGKFPRKLAEGYVTDRRGFIWTPEQTKTVRDLGPFTPVVLPEGAREPCPTCNDTQELDQRLGGIATSGVIPCPDCGGRP